MDPTQIKKRHNPEASCNTSSIAKTESQSRHESELRHDSNEVRTVKKINSLLCKFARFSVMASNSDTSDTLTKLNYQFVAI